MFGVQPASIRSINKVSFQTPRIGKRRCSAVREPTRHSLSPSHNHQLVILPSLSSKPSRNNGNSCANSGILKLPTIEKIFLLMIACSGRKVTNLSRSSAIFCRFEGRSEYKPGKTRTRYPKLGCLCVYCTYASPRRVCTSMMSPIFARADGT